MRNRKLAAVIAGIMTAAVLLTGCADKPLDASQVAATVDGEEISLGLANFAAKLEQAQTESYYMMFFGNNMWDQESNGVTMEDSTKANVMSMLQELYIVRNHAEEYGVEITEDDTLKIAEAAANFVIDNTDTALDKLTATEDVITEYLELITIQKRVSDEVIKAVDTNVSDEEAAQRKIDYVYISTDSYVNDDGETVDYTEDEKKERLEIAEEILAEAKESKDLESAASEHEFTMSSATYGEDDTSLTEELREAADKLSEGEYADVVESEYGCYVVYLASEFDEEATEAKKADIIEERESALYLETYEEWSKDSELIINEDVWKQVTFAAPITVVTNEEEHDHTEE